MAASRLDYYPGVLNKSGLEPDDFEELLKSKMSELLGEEQEIKDVNKSIQSVKLFCIRSNTSDRTQLDGRGCVCKVLAALALLPDQPTSSLGLSNVPDAQGSSNPTEDACEGDHKKHYERFLKMEDVKFDSKGYLNNSNGERCNTIEMCSEIDSITQKYIDELKDGNSKKPAAKPNSQAAKREREPLKRVFETCKSNRIYMDWAVKYDLMSEDGYKQWKEHVCVIVSFAALVVIIDALSKSPKYGKDNLVDELIAARLCYPGVLNKLGLQPAEFEGLLKSKMSKLLKEQEIENVDKSIQLVKQVFGLRSNTRDPTKLDQRRTSSKVLHVSGFVEDPTVSPVKLAKQKRAQGSSNPTKDVHEGYHNKQYELFLEILKDAKFDSKGYFLKSNGDRCNTIEMCNKIDIITQNYIDEVKEPVAKPNLVAATREKEPLRKVFEHCQSILMGRMFLDWAEENDIMSEDGYKQWKEHVWVIMSFAALVVIIDVLSRSPRYGEKSLVDEVKVPIVPKEESSRGREGGSSNPTVPAPRT